MSLLSVENLRMYYNTSLGDVRAVDGISFCVEEREILGVVGESGCGKSSLALTLIRLLPQNGRIVDGKVMFEGLDVTAMQDSEVRRKVRWKKVSIIPQGAMNSLNPVFNVGSQIAEVITAHSGEAGKVAFRRAEELLEAVGIDPSRAKHYPHEFSGGMKQRAMIAMSLALNPSLLIADEPTTALDVIVQAGIIRLLLAVREKYGTSIILISHDLALVAQLSDRVAIMYAGKISEYGRSADVYGCPLHPYTMGLVSAFADIRRPRERLVSMPGTPPDLVNPPVGCRFNPRCPYARELCREKEPPLEEAISGHLVACHFWREISERQKGVSK